MFSRSHVKLSRVLTVYICVIFFFVWVDYHILSKKGDHGKSGESQLVQRTGKDPTRGSNILLLSSLGRSGSSFLAEILTTLDHSIYFYEPIRALPPEDIVDTALVLQELRNYFSCRIRQEFLEYGRSPYVSVRHPYVASKSLEDVDPAVLRHHCLQEPQRIVKTIRTRLAWVKELLKDDELDLKVIHLVRDPRGTLLSATKLDWNISPFDTCPKLEEDLHTRKEFERLFPDKYLFVKYENLVRKPTAQTQRILRFLRNGGDSSNPVVLPKRTEIYLDFHTMGNIVTHINKPYGTYRFSRDMFQSWRNEITGPLLSEFQDACHGAILAMGHRIFKTLWTAQDLSVSLFRDDD